MSGKTYRANMTFAVGGEIWRHGDVKRIPPEHLTAWEPFISNRTITKVIDPADLPAPVASTEYPAVDTTPDAAAVALFETRTPTVIDYLTQLGPVEGATVHVDPLIVSGSPDVGALVAERIDFDPSFDPKIGAAAYSTSVGAAPGVVVAQSDGGELLDGDWLASDAGGDE